MPEIQQLAYLSSRGGVVRVRSQNVSLSDGVQMWRAWLIAIDGTTCGRELMAQLMAQLVAQVIVVDGHE